MKKAISRKGVLYILISLLISNLIGCISKQPDITGLWEADFWNGALIEFYSDFKFYTYEDFETAINKDYYQRGQYLFYEINSQDCFGIGLMAADQKQIINMTSAVEFVSGDHILLISDKNCILEGYVDIHEELDSAEINLWRID